MVDAFQEVLNVYSNKLSDREHIHLFISSSAGLPFALGTRINTNICPYVQTYQYDRAQTPRHREAILVTKENNDRIVLSGEDKKIAGELRKDWENQLQSKLKPFIKTITSSGVRNWLHTVCETNDEYKMVIEHLKSPWNKVISISSTSLLDDKIDQAVPTVDGGVY